MFKVVQYKNTENYARQRNPFSLGIFETDALAIQKAQENHTFADWDKPIVIIETGSGKEIYYIEGNQTKDFRTPELIKEFNARSSEDYIHSHSAISIKDPESEKGSYLRKFHYCLYQLCKSMESDLKTKGIIPCEAVRKDGSFKQSPIEITTHTNLKGKLIGSLTFYNGGEALKYNIDETGKADSLLYNPKVFISKTNDNYVGFVDLDRLQILGFELNDSLKKVYDNFPKMIPDLKRTPEYLFYTYVKNCIQYGTCNPSLNDGTKEIYTSNFIQGVDGEPSFFTIRNHKNEGYELMLLDSAVKGMKYLVWDEWSMHPTTPQKRNIPSPDEIAKYAKDPVLAKYAKNCIGMEIPFLHASPDVQLIQKEDGSEILRVNGIQMDIQVENTTKDEDDLEDLIR